MQLRYDHDLRCYVGQRCSVDECTFLEALQALIMAGCEPEPALAYLLDEDRWSSLTTGVRPLPPTANCRYCGAPLPPPRRAFCNAVCEASRTAGRARDRRRARGERPAP